MPTKERRLKEITGSPEQFTSYVNDIQLYPFQLEAFQAIWSSIFNCLGDSIVLIFSRQSGKDELIANLIVYLFARLHNQESTIICAQPTFQPQTVNAMDRLESRLKNPKFNRTWHRTGGFRYHFDRAVCTYLSAERSANVVGATAGTLLIINEAQDVDPAVYDKKFAPMAASGNATRLFSGTSWTSNTLLARELRSARQAEQADGRKRVFIVTGEEVGRCNASYKAFMGSEIAKLGRNNPIIKSQYFCEEIDAEVSLFNPARMALTLADRPGQTGPHPGSLYAFCIDVAGMESPRISDLGSSALSNPTRDSTTLSIVEVDLSTLATLQAPTYRVVSRRQWTGANHLTVFGQLNSLAGSWKPRHIVIDATGVGEGLWVMLDRAYPGKVTPVKFTQSVKSEIGWRFLAIIETGRLRLCSPEPVSSASQALPSQAGRMPSYEEVLSQYAACKSEVLVGPGKIMRWSVPAGKRDASGNLLHDDHLLADALIARLDRLDWSITHPMQILDTSYDPLRDLTRDF